MSKFNADINSAGDGWIQVTISGDTANTLTEAQIASSLSTLPIAGEGPEGWQLVPTVATLEMEHAAVARVKPFHDEDWYRIMPKDLFRLAWKALLNAAPTPPSSPGKDGWQPVGMRDEPWVREEDRAKQDAARSQCDDRGAEVASTPNAARDVLAERERQKAVEGWTPAHDDGHTDNELSRAAACYAIGNISYWPWSLDWWKPTDRRRNLVKAGALIIAEIERLDRSALSASQSTSMEGESRG